MSDVFDPAIKYGGGDESFRKLLGTWSAVVIDVEDTERFLADARMRLDKLRALRTLSSQAQIEVMELESEVAKQIQKLEELKISAFNKMKEALENFSKFQKRA